MFFVLAVRFDFPEIHCATSNLIPDTSNLSSILRRVFCISAFSNTTFLSLIFHALVASSRAKPFMSSASFVRISYMALGAFPLDKPVIALLTAAALPIPFLTAHRLLKSDSVDSSPLELNRIPLAEILCEDKETRHLTFCRD